MKKLEPDENNIGAAVDDLVEEKMHEHGVDRIISIRGDDFIITCEICGQKFNTEVGHMCKGMDEEI